MKKTLIISLFLVFLTSCSSMTKNSDNVYSNTGSFVSKSSSGIINGPEFEEIKSMALDYYNSNNIDFSGNDISTGSTDISNGNMSSGTFSFKKKGGSDELLDGTRFYAIKNDSGKWKIFFMGMGEVVKDCKDLQKKYTNFDLKYLENKLSLTCEDIK